MDMQPQDGVRENSQPTEQPAAVVVRQHRFHDGEDADVLRRVLPAWLSSGGFHIILLTCFLLITLVAPSPRPAAAPPEIQTEVDAEAPPKANLENDELGLNPSELLNYNLDRIESVSVPGRVNPNDLMGIKDAPDGQMLNVSPPPGLGGNVGQGGGLDALTPRTGSLVGFVGGFPGGTFVAGGPGGRSGATRQKLVQEGGGNSQSEAAVAAGLKWLVQHQARDGHWSLDGFNQQGRCNCSGFGQRNDIAATAFGLLPLLGAGETHKNSKLYSDHVHHALDYLISRQNKEGYFGSGMYAHGLATIALCEAYALTTDAKLRSPAQRAISFIRSAQSNSGGWRYQPRQDGDTSVVGWQVMALKSGQMGGLEVDDSTNPTLAQATKWLDSCMTTDGSGYGYTGPQATSTMTAVGLLCRQYLGWNPRNPKLVAGVNTLNKTPPGELNSIYYYYYATQVLHHMGGDVWKNWNAKMRDLLLKKQDKGDDAKRPHLKGSWPPAGDVHGGAGGRMMQTSLSILTLEVYYRYLPLYQPGLTGRKDTVLR
jgi:prenyltransferase beta subunit